MANDVNISILLDIYGNTLTEKQRNTLDLYYNQDLSLAEIAEHHNITRQGVRDAIERGKAYLLYLEKNIGLMSKFKETHEKALKIMKISNSLIEYNKDYCGSSSIKNFAVEIYDIANSIYED